MTNATKNTLKSVIVLSIISIVCVALLAIANNVFPKPDTSAKLDSKTISLLNGICQSESYEIVYSTDDQIISDYNTKKGTKYKYINAIYRATGDTNYGKLIVESIGNGYQNGTVTVLVAYNSDKSIMGIELKSYDSAKNNYMKDKLVKNNVLKGIFASLVGSIGNVGKADNISAKTGATNSLNGVATAINFANEFILSLDVDSLPPIEIQPINSALYVNGEVKLCGGKHE